jgi:hypothetical protein
MAAANADDVPLFIVSTKRDLPPGWDNVRCPFSVAIPANEDVLLGGIVAGAFEGCSGLTGIVIPEGVAKILIRAFARCSGLTSLNLPESCTEIGGTAFGDCSGLTSLQLPEGCTEIGEYTFAGCSGLTSLNLPDGCTNIGDGAFAGCSGLTSLDLPEGCTEIGVYALTGCSGLTSAVLPEGVGEIREGVFCRCSWLVVVSVRSRLPIVVDSSAFDACTHLTLMVAPRASGLVGAVVGGVTVVEDTAANRRRALDLQYWRASTHGLCSPRRRSWVLAVHLVANRVRGGPLALPHEMWCAILGAIRRCELGPAP